MTASPDPLAKSTLRPGIRTFKPRRSRITTTAERALSEHGDLMLPMTDMPVDLDLVFGSGAPVVMEIGCGDGRATVAMAAADPSVGILAIDVHTPGLGELLARAGAARVTNVRVIEGDAIGVLERMIPEGSLHGLRSYFPDPWPKARHHKRRLVQPAVIELVRTRLAIGGTWHLATDWSEYAEQMLECFAADPHWSGGVINRPADRPVTRYEARALREGRLITDLRFERVD